mgnify:FL=1
MTYIGNKIIILCCVGGKETIKLRKYTHNHRFMESK